MQVLCLASAAGSSVIAGSTMATYVGPETCARCHRSIADSQERTAMAKTWVSDGSLAFPLNFSARTLENSAVPTEYRIDRVQDHLTYSLIFPDQNRQTVNAISFTAPVNVVIGGNRHGLGFLVKIDQIEDVPLERPAFVQARYFWSPKGADARRQATKELARPSGGALDTATVLGGFLKRPKETTLVLAPGLSAERPASFEAALGLVLSPGFEKRCLACHGQPQTLGAGKQGGVRCESCHGPGSLHVEDMAKGDPPIKYSLRGLPPDEAIEVCAQCHAGFGKHLDPAADDLLIANQVGAIKTSECFIQSGRSFSCLSCHKPHSDSAEVEAKTVETCLSCHSIKAERRAALCPINANSACVSCHMPTVDIGPLHLVDHQIRVHPEQIKGQGSTRPHTETRSQYKPVRVFLRVIANNDHQRIIEAKRELDSGRPFYDVAREYSTEPSADIGGYLGEKQIAQLEPPFNSLIANLGYGEISQISSLAGKWLIFERLSRDFRWQADQKEQEAEAFLARGEISAATQKAQEALKIYPQFRRALLFMGKAIALGGNIPRAAEVLSVTSRLYPADAASLFALGTVIGKLGRQKEEIAAYRRALELEPDLIATYLRLGDIYEERNDPSAAIDIFHRGLQIDPLSVELNRSLSRVLSQQGKTAEAQRYARLAVLLGRQE